MASSNGWIGVDLDGTLAFYDGWVGPEYIGPPIPRMVKRVKLWLSEGKKVRIFTARVHDGKESTRKVIEKWCKRNLGKVLPITNVKDFQMLELWDDRAVQVETNTGRSYKEDLDKLRRRVRYNVVHLSRPKD